LSVVVSSDVAGMSAMCATEMQRAPGSALRSEKV